MTKAGLGIAGVCCVAMTLAGCGAGAGDASDVDWNASAAGRASTASGCFEKAGNPRQWIQSAPTTGTTSRLQIIDHCAGASLPLASTRIQGTRPLASSSTFLVTQNWNPHGGAGTYNAHPIGVEYDDVDGSFWIRNEDGAPIAPGASFNIALDPGPVASASDNPGKAFFVPGATSDPATSILLTHFIDPPGRQKAIDVVQPIVKLVGGAWQILNADETPVAPYESFTVAVAGASFVAASTRGDFAYLDPPVTNPEAIVFVTERYAAPPKGTTTSPMTASPLGVWYDTGAGRWAVFNEDLSPMKPGAAFNVWTP